MRLRNEFGVDLALRQLFEAPTVEGLSGLVEGIVGQAWLTRVWAEVLRRDEVQPDENFFELGGESELLAAVQRRISVEFGRQIPIDRLVAHPTVREQAELMISEKPTQPALPVGVIPLQTKGTGNPIFWMHYFNFSLSNVMGEERPFLVVRMLSEDFPALGEAPTLESIAACHVRKIIATQPQGPYTVGGLCLGAVLAFEVGYQLRAAGHEVSLLLLDPPSPSTLEGGMRPKLTQPLYLLKRASRLGFKTSIARLRNRLFPQPAPPAEVQAPKTEVNIAQGMLERAAAMFQPRQYDGRVLVVLADERPPHLDFLPAWQKVIPTNLDAQTLPGHHEDLIYGESAHRVAKVIHTHLGS